MGAVLLAKGVVLGAELLAKSLRKGVVLAAVLDAKSLSRGVVLAAELEAKSLSKVVVLAAELLAKGVVLAAKLLAKGVVLVAELLAKGMVSGAELLAKRVVLGPGARLAHPPSSLKNACLASASVRPQTSALPLQQSCSSELLPPSSNLMATATFPGVLPGVLTSTSVRPGR